MFIQFERPPDDARRALDAATALDLREIDFFRLAYRRWHGRDIRPNLLEHAFAEYMFHRRVPLWVRHFARQVFDGEASGCLDPLALGAGRYKHRPPPPKHAKFIVAVTIGASVLYSFVLMDIGTPRQTAAPLYCQGGAGFKFFADMSYAISGKERPRCGRLDMPR
jgi:hypothetical protein